MDFVIYKNILSEYLGVDEEVFIPFGIKTIGDCAFDTPYNFNIEKIYIPSSVTKIGENAFAYCENLEKVTLPLTFMGNLDESIFSGCYNLKEINFS